MGNNKNICDCDYIHEDIVKNITPIMLEDKEYSEIANFFKVLGDNNRTKIIWLLDEKEMCVCDIAYLCNMTKSAVSHQLSILKEKNLVKSERNGKEVIYALKDDHVKFMLENGIKHVEEEIK